MDLRTFLENFDTIAEAPNGIPKLRSLILDLAVRGKLVPQNPEDEPATLLVKQTITLKQELLKAKKIRKTDILFPAQELIKESLLDGWVVSPLGILCFLLVDGSHNPPSKQEKGIPMLSGQNVRDGYITLDASRYITEEDYNQEISRTPIREGDVFLSIVGSIGRSAVVPREFPKCALQRSIALIRTNLYPQYLSLFLRSSVALQYYEEHGKGTAQKGIYLNKLSELEVIIPPLDEQKRIVAKVNELMELCDRLSSTQQTRDNLRQKLRKSAIDSLMNADDEASEKGRAIVRDNWQTFSQSPEDVGDLRRAVLELAVQGKLVPQNLEDKPAESTLLEIAAEQQKLIQAGQLKKESELVEIEDKQLPFLPKGWKYCYLQDLKVFGPRNGYSPKAVEYPTSVRSITLTATTSGRFKGEFFKYINEQIESKSHLWLQPGDLLIQRSNTLAYVGTAAIYDQAPAKYIYPDLIMRIRLSEKVDVKYVHLVLSGRASKQHFHSNASGTAGTMPKINQKAINSLRIPLPPIAEQKRIVAKVDKLMEMCDRLEESLRQSQQQAEALAASAISHLTI